MKHKLLSLLALTSAMCMSTSVMAQEFVEPVKPTAPVREAFDGTWVAPEVGKTYYIYNTGAAQFIGAGRDWGTRTVTTTDSIVSLTSSKITCAANKNYVLPITVVADATYDGCVKFQTNNNNKSLFISGDGNNSWSDYAANSNLITWQLVAIEGMESTYAFHNRAAYEYDADPQDVEEVIAQEGYTEADSTAAEATELDKYRLLGVCAIENGTYTWNDLKDGGINWEGLEHKVYWKFVECTDATAQAIRDWRSNTQADLDAKMKLYNDSLAVYNAKATLRTTIQAAADASVDYTSALAVYNNADATIADVLAANTSLQLTMTISGQEPPVDITSVLQNANFEAGNITGWETNYVSGKQANNIGYQDNKSYTNGDVTISKFIEAWLPGPATIGDGYLQQTVYGLPAGIYRLECDAIAVQQSNATATSEGAYLFIQAGSLGAKTSLSTGNEKPEHFTVSFNNDGTNAMSFGLKTENTTANWICADNFKLYYDGELTESPHYTQLKEYLQTVTAEYNNTIDQAYLNMDVKDALNAMMEAAENITTESTDADCDSAYVKLEVSYKAALASIKAYARFKEYIQDGGKMQEFEIAASENGWDDLASKLSVERSEYMTLYDEGTITDNEIDSVIVSIQPEIIAWMKENPDALKEGNDLTILLVNPDFSEGTYYLGWPDDEPGYDEKYGTIPGWTISSGNITQMKGGVIETFHRKFDFNQTIENMPAGVYNITVQGFVRHDKADDTESTIFYAGDLQSSLMERSDQWSAEQIYTGSAMGDPCGGANADEQITNSKNEKVYVPNGMSGFYFWSQTENAEGSTMDYTKWEEGDLYYTNHIKAYLMEDGDFTIGMKSLDKNDWIIWDNFKITYLGAAGEIYAKMAEEEFNSLTALVEKTDYMTVKAQDTYNNINTTIDYTAIDNINDYNAFKLKTDSLVAYIKEGAKLGLALYNKCQDYQNKTTYVTFDTSDFLNGILTEYISALENKESADNDYLKNGPKELAKAWTQAALADADPTAFGNLTDVIEHPWYKDNNDAATLSGWQMEKADSITFGNYLAEDGVGEVYNPSGEYKHYQEIIGLTAGYYHVTVDGFFRQGEAGAATNPTLADREKFLATTTRAFLFAEGEEFFITPLKNILVGYETQLGYVDAESKSTEKTWTWAALEEGAEPFVEYTPNTKSAAFGYFNDAINLDAVETALTGEADNQSVYRNAIDAKVGEDGILKIGITNKGVDKAAMQGTDWACFSNWTLTYIGTEAPDAVKGVNVQGSNVPVVIYTIDGRQSSRLQRGLNIIRNANGSVKKVLVK